MHHHRDPAARVADRYRRDVFGSLARSGATAPATWSSPEEPGQPEAPLITGSVIAPLETPHLSRIALYVPSVINAFTAPRIASLVVPAVFGIAIPYGAES